MMTLDQIKRSLEDRSPSKVAKATGLHFHTIRRIRDGDNTNPTRSTLEALSKYLESRP